MNLKPSRRAVAVSVAGSLAVVGLLTAVVGAMVVAGMFGISTALASQIVRAVEVGGWVLGAVFAVLTGGIAGISIGLIRGLIARYGTTVAAA